MACKLNSRNNKIHTSEVLSGCMKYQFPATPFFLGFFLSALSFTFLSFSLKTFPLTHLRLLSNSYFLSFFILFLFSLFSSKPLPLPFFFFFSRSLFLSSLEKLFIPSRKWPLPLSHADSSKTSHLSFFFPSFDFPFSSLLRFSIDSHFSFFVISPSSFPDQSLFIFKKLLFHIKSSPPSPPVLIFFLFIFFFYI